MEKAIFLVKENTQTVYQVSRIDYASEAIWGRVIVGGIPVGICREFSLKDVDVHSLNI